MCSLTGKVCLIALLVYWVLLESAQQAGWNGIDGRVHKLVHMLIGNAKKEHNGSKYRVRHAG